MATSTFISSSLVSSNVYLWDKYGSNAYLNGGIALTRKAAADANGRFCWSSGAVSRFTNTATPKLYDPIYATAAATDQTVVTSVTSVGATGIYAGGSGLLLAPTTRLGCVEMNTAGGISRTGDTLSFDSTVLPPIVSSHFVPLVKTSTGTPTSMTYELTSTMYGNMFSPNASAVVGSVGISTGYGTLLLNSYTVVDTIRSQVPAGALTIPSEAAASVALANKQGALTILGDTLLLDSDNNLSLRVATGIATTSSAYWEYKVPTELAVRNAINVASGGCINHADDLYDTIINSHYATEVWVTENFALKGEGGGGQIEGSYGPATYNSEGMVRPVLDGGLIITNAAHADLAIASANASTFGGMRIGSNFYTTSRTLNNVVYEHCLTLSAATSDVLGGITVPAGNGGLTLTNGALSLTTASTYVNYAGAAAGVYGGVKVVGAIASTSITAYLSSGYVPSVQAVYNHVSEKLTSYTDTDTISNTYVKKTDSASPSAFGIVRPRSGLVTTAGVLDLASATSTTIGGVIIRPYTGLAINSGTLSLDNNVYKAFYYQGTDASDGFNKYNIENAQVVDSIGRILYYDFSVSGSVANNTLATLYGTITSQGNLVASNATSDGVYGKYGWKNGTTTVYYTLTATPSVGDPVYGSRSVNTTKIIGYVSAAASSGVAVTSVTAALWSYTQNYTSTQNSAGVFCFPIAMLRAGLNTVETYQIQTTPVVSGTPLQGGKPVSQGAGAVVTDAIDSYVVALDKATTAAIGGVVIGNGIDINAGGTISVAASASAKPVSSGSGISVTDSGGSYTVTLNNAGTGSIGGVQIPLNSGLSLNTTDGTLKLSSATATSIGGVIVPSNKGLGINNGSITLSSASKYTTYSGATEQADSGNLGGVVIMTQIASASTENESAASVVPTVNAVFSAISATGAKPISQGTGVTVTDAGGSNTISLKSATSNIIGGVYVPNYSGLALNAGKLTIDPFETDVFKVRVTSSGTGSRTFTVSKQLVVDTAGHILCYRDMSNVIVSAASPQKTIYAKVTKNENSGIYRRYAAGDLAGGSSGYCWSRTIVTGKEFIYTLTTTPAQYEPIFSSSVANSEIIGHIYSSATTGLIYTYFWSLSVNTTSAAIAVPIASVSILSDTDLTPQIYQLQTGAVVSGAIDFRGADVVSTYASASSLASGNSYGGVVAMNSVTSANDTTAKTYAIVPTTDAVYSALSATSNWVSNNYVSNGTIANWTSAPVYSTYESASAGSFGVVKVMNEIISGGAEYYNSAYVPNVDAVYRAAYGYFGDFEISKENIENSDNVKYSLDDGHVYIPGTAINQMAAILDGTVTAAATATVDLWLNIVSTTNATIFSASLSTTPSTAADTYSVLLEQWYLQKPYRQHRGPVAWPSGINAASVYDGEFAVKVDGETDNVFNIAAGNIYVNGTAITGAAPASAVTIAGATDTIWGAVTFNGTVCTMAYTSGAAPGTNVSTYYAPIAQIKNGTVNQYQYGPIMINGRWA